MKPQSAKNKGRILQAHIKERLHEHFPELEDDDILSRSMGSPGEDLHLSPRAQSLIPLDIEAKNVEKLRLWESWEQCKANSTDTPCLVTKRNRSEVLAILRLDDLLEILKEKNESSNSM